MFLDPSINWNSIYRRNNKTKNKKHLLCFPDHTDGKHKENGFCGQSINVFININQIKSISPIVYGRFSLLGSHSDAHSVGDIIPINSIITDALSESPYYLAVEKGNCVDKIVFTVNPRLKGWNYGRALTHTELLYSFFVYLFEKIDENNLICRDRVTSPPFRLCTSRRCSTTPTQNHTTTTTTTTKLKSTEFNRAIPKSPLKISINNNNNNNKSPNVINTPEILVESASPDIFNNISIYDDELPTSYSDINQSSSLKLQELEIPPPQLHQSNNISIPFTPIQSNNKEKNYIEDDSKDFMDMGELSDIINSFPPLSPCNSQSHLNSKTVMKNDPESPKATQVMELKGKKETMENLPGINSTTAFVKEEDGRSKEYFRFIQNIPISSDSRRTEIAPNGDDIEDYLEHDITRPLYQLDRCGRIIPLEHLINYVFEDDQN